MDTSTRTQEEIDNICPFCKGKGEVALPEKLKKIWGKTHTSCAFCNGIGTLVEYLKFQLEVNKKNTDREIKKYKELQEYVKITSTCKTCGGDQFKTWGSFGCKECGIPGTGYLPG